MVSAAVADSGSVTTVVVSAAGIVTVGVSTSGAVTASTGESCGSKSSANDAVSAKATKPEMAIAIVRLLISLENTLINLPELCRRPCERVGSLQFLQVSYLPL
jgi:hypothetical protein